MPACEALQVVCIFDGASDKNILYGKKGLIKRMMAMIPEAKFNFAALKIRDLQLPAAYLALAQCGSYITEDPFNAVRYIEAIDVDAMMGAFDKWEKLSPDFKAKALAQTRLSK